MDKLTAIKIKYDDGTYSDEIPVSVLSENVEWDNTHTLVDILGSIDVDVTGTIQDQISQLFNEKISNSELSNYVANQLSIDVANWLNTNVNPTGSTVMIDKTFSVEGAAADAKLTGNNVIGVKNALRYLGTVNDIPVKIGTQSSSSVIIKSIDSSGEYEINGSTSYNAYMNLFREETSFPDFVSAGDEIICGINANGPVKLDVSYYKNGSFVTNTTINENTYIKFKIDAEATGFYIRFRFPANSSYSNIIAYPYLLTSLAKQQLEQEILDVKEKEEQINELMPTADDVQIVNPDEISIVHMRLNRAGVLIADANYDSIIIPALMEINATYCMKIFNESLSLGDLKLYTFDSVELGESPINSASLLSQSDKNGKIVITENANYFLLVTYLQSGNVTDLISSLVLAKTPNYPTEYHSYYMSVNEAIKKVQDKIEPDVNMIIDKMPYDYNYVETTPIAGIVNRWGQAGGATQYAYIEQSVKAGEKYRVSGYYFGGNFPAYIILNDGAVIDYHNEASQGGFENLEITIPNNATDLIINGYPPSYTAKLYKYDIAQIEIKGIHALVGPDYRYKYNDINNAIIQNPNSVITVDYGTYETEIQDLTTDKKIIGKDKDLCILTGTNKNYDSPPIEIAGGIIKNFTIIMQNDEAADHKGYCLHSDNAITVDKTLLVENCDFFCTGQHTVGIGIRSGQTLIFNNCYFENNDSDAAHQPFYVHNNSGANPAIIKFHNCYFKGYGYCMKLQAWGTGNTMKFEFINCTCVSETYGTADDCVWTDYVSGETHDTNHMHDFINKLVLMDTSHGNNISVLNA